MRICRLMVLSLLSWTQEQLDIDLELTVMGSEAVRGPGDTPCIWTSVGILGSAALTPIC